MKKLKKTIIISVGILLSIFIDTKIFATAQVNILSVSPSNPSTNSDITVKFWICGNSGQDLRFAVGIRETAFSTSDFNRTNWLADDRGIYRNETSYWYGTSTGTVTGLNTTDVLGPNAGLTAGTGTGCPNGITVTVITHIPPEIAGNYYIVVVARENSLQLTCSSNTGVDSSSSQSISISGSAVVKADLQVCNNGTTNPDTQIDMKYRIINRGEAGVPIDEFKWRYWFYDSDTNWASQASLGLNAYLSDGTTYCNVGNPQNEYSFTTLTYTADCGNSRTANMYYQYSLANYNPSTSQPYFIPPNGGYIENNNTVWFRQQDVGQLDFSDDYSRITEAANCSSGWSDLDEITLYHNDELQCEWKTNTITLYVDTYSDTTSGYNLYVDKSAPNTNYGPGNSNIRVDTWGGGVNDIRRGLAWADFSSIPQDATLWNVDFSMKQQNCYAATNMTINRLTTDWEYTQATWNSPTAGASWSNGEISSSDWTTDGEDTTYVSCNAGSFFTWDATDIARAWVNGGENNYGIVIRVTDESTSNVGCTFIQATGDINSRGKFVVYYTSYDSDSSKEPCDTGSVCESPTNTLTPTDTPTSTNTPTNTPTPTSTPTIWLHIEKKAQRDVVTIGDTVIYTITFSNLSDFLVLSISEDFGAGTLTGWTDDGNSNANWSAANGYLEQTTNSASMQNQYPNIWKDSPDDVYCGQWQADMWINSSNDVGDGNGDATLVLKKDSTNANAYHVRIENDNGGGLRIDKMTGGSWSNIGSYTTTINLQTWYTVKADLIIAYPGVARIRAKVWQRGSAEPSNWQLVVYDNSTTSTLVGKTGFQAEEGPNRYDNFYFWKYNQTYNIDIWDTIPTDTTYQSSSDSGSLSSGMVIWQNLSACAKCDINKYVTFTVIVDDTATANEIINNYASLKSDEMSSPQQSLNEPITVKIPGLWVEKSTDITYTVQEGDTITYYLTYSNPSGWYMLTHDTFKRGNYSGWLPKTSTAIWTAINGYLEQQYNSGYHRIQKAQPESVSCGIFQTDAYVPSNSAGSIASFYFRYIDSNNWYRARLNTNGNLYFDKNVNGTTTYGVASSNVGFTSDQWWTMKVYVKGNIVRMKAWQRGNSEPGSWNIDTTDSDLGSSNPGTIQYQGQGYVDFDNLYVWAPVDSKEVTLWDSIPNGTEFISAEGGGTYSNGVVSWNLGTVSGCDAPKKVTFVVKVTDCSLTEVLNYSNDKGLGFGVDTSNYVTLTALNTCLPDVALHKSIDKTEVVIGDTITYCITYTNEGSNTVTSFHIWDTIPEVTTFIGCDNSCTTQNIGGRTIVSWTIPTIYPGDSGTVCFWVQVTSYPYYKFEEKFFAILNRFNLWDKRKKENYDGKP